MGNPFIHIELASTDLDTSKAFYSALFEWQLPVVPMPNGTVYTMIEPGDLKEGGTKGGMMQQMQPGAPSAWLPYVYVPDIKAATEKAKALGATVMADCMEVPETGWLSVFKDPTGAVLGMWQPMARG